MNESKASSGHLRVDVAIVGGGAAGLAAALQLGRARRSVVVIDSGAPRNAPSAHMHAYLGHEGRPPLEFLEIGRREVAQYGVEVLATSVVDVEARDGHFVVSVADGATIVARKVIAATGVRDELPEIPGVAERWGRDVIHCPYCHGWEVRDQRIVVIATRPVAAHSALLFRQLSRTVVIVAHSGEPIAEEERVRLEARGVQVIDGPVERLQVDDDAITGVALVDGRTIGADAVVVLSRAVPNIEPFGSLDLRVVDAPMGMGEMLDADMYGATSVPGFSAVGNLKDLASQVLLAAADGSRVGAFVNFALAVDDADAEVSAAR